MTDKSEGGDRHMCSPRLRAQIERAAAAIGARVMSDEEFAEWRKTGRDLGELQDIELRTENPQAERITEEMNVHQAWYEAARKQTVESLPEFMRHLTRDYLHDYGTICHATAAAGLAAMWAMNAGPQGGITGFQAGCILWSVIGKWNGTEGRPQRLVEYDELLFPQYERAFRQISRKTADWLRTEAGKRLAEGGEVSDRVRAHWEFVAGGGIPFGLTVEDDEDGVD